MSNKGLIIEERSRDLGDFLVGRLLPFRKKRMVGPFIFIDHMGPTKLGPSHYLDVDQHPHIGLSTLTYLLEGQIMHEDSIGTRQLITPGSVNWMIAGKGCAHTERTPKELRDGNTFVTHGYQIWVALPKELEDIVPSFHNFKISELPTWKDIDAHFTLVAGNAYGYKSPVPVHSNLFMIDLKTTETYNFTSGNNLKGEIGILVVKGGINACEENILAGNMLVSKTEDVCNIQIQPNSHLLLFGGEAFPEERHIYWNFVSHSLKKIETAKTKWKNKDWPKVNNDNTYVPLPKPIQFK